MKISKVSAVAAMVFSLMSVNVIAETGTVTMAGEVTEQSCYIPASQMTRTVAIGEIDGNDSATPNSAVSSQDLSFNVAGCPAGTNDVGVTFNFEADATNSSYLKNNGNSQGFLLGVTKADDSLITSGSLISSEDFDALTGTGTVNAKIKAYRVASTPVVEGNINSLVSVTLTTQ